MAAISLGKISTASIVTGAACAASRTPCQSFTVQALAANTGVIYICDAQTPNLTTFVGVLYQLSAPASSAATSVRPGITFENNQQPVSFDLSKIYILPTVASEGAIVTYITT